MAHWSIIPAVLIPGIAIQGIAAWAVPVTSVTDPHAANSADFRLVIVAFKAIGSPALHCAQAVPTECQISPTKR